MPGLGATDPADLEAQARAELGFSRRPRSIVLPYVFFIFLAKLPKLYLYQNWYDILLLYYSSIYGPEGRLLIFPPK